MKEDAHKKAESGQQTSFTHMPESQILVHNCPPNPDPRIYAANIFKAVSGNSNDNKLVSAAVNAQFGGNQVLFPAPAPAALCLNLSNQAFRRAQVIIGTEIFKKTAYGFTAEDGVPELYDLFEQLILNVVFAYTALEAFSNQLIPDDFVFVRVRQDGKCEESYDKEQTERYLSLDLKLAEIIPKITGQRFHKGTSLWNEYASLRDIRDRIIHVKSADLGVKHTKETNIWADLLERRAVDSSLVAHKVIKHFPLKPDNSSPVAMGRNRWATLFPFVRQNDEQPER